MNENKSNYVKLVAGILETELDLKPDNPASQDPNDRRVFIYNQNFILPKYDYMLIVLSDSPGKTMANRSRFESSTNKEIQELIIQKEVGIDVMSRNSEARERKEEVLMALASFYSQQVQEANGFRVFSYSTLFADVSEVEGAGRINRYRASINLHCKYTKGKAVDYFSHFKSDAVYN